MRERLSLAINFEIMNTKKVVLLIPLVMCSVILALFLIDKIQGPCSVTYFDFSGAVPASTEVTYCDKAIIDFVPEAVLQFLAFILLPSSFLFFLSLITYKMRDEVFRAWWNFARWWVPVIIAVTLLLTNASGGGTLGMNQDFTVFILGILYAILVLTSLVRIVRTYLKAKS